MESNNHNELTTCCICGHKFLGYGHNAEPIVSNGICCDKCNFTVVMPRRIAKLSEHEKNLYFGVDNSK